MANDDDLKIVDSKPLPNLTIKSSMPLPGQAKDAFGNPAGRIIMPVAGGVGIPMDLGSAGAAQEFEKQKQGAVKTGAELESAGLAGEAVPALRGLLGVITRMGATGGGAAAGNVVGQVATTGTVNPKETAQTGGAFAGLEGIGEAFSGLKGALSKLFYSGGVAADGTPELSKVGRAILHPTELPEAALRATVPPPEEAIAAAKAQAGELNAKDLEAKMAEVEAARQKELAQWERLKNIDAQAKMNRGRQQTALDLVEAKKNAPSPFEGAPSNPTGKIVSPDSPPPPINKTYVSYPADLLVKLAEGGDLNAWRELIRNPRGLDITQIKGYKFLMDAHVRPGRVYGGPTE